MPLLQKYKLNITWGDQDLLNIIFHHNPGKLHTHMHICKHLFTQLLTSIDNFKKCIHSSTVFLTKVFVHFHSQSACWSFRASGIIVRITASMAVTVRPLRKTASSSCMATEGFTMTTNSLPSEPCTRPYERWACRGVFVEVYVCSTGLLLCLSKCEFDLEVLHRSEQRDQ